MYNVSLGLYDDRPLVLVATASPSPGTYTFPEAGPFIKNKFDEVWPTYLLFLTACAGVSLAIYFIKSLGK